MEISTMQELIRNIKESKKKLKEVSAPQLTDVAAIPALYECFLSLMPEKRMPQKKQKYLFVAVIVKLYSPISYVGVSLPRGIRTPLAEVLHYNSSAAISVAVKKVIYEYKIYSKFRSEVDQICNYILSVYPSLATT
ncbi:MAG: hypothetical protein R3Y50_08730 [Rikenellaceae bacterium]